MRLVHESTGEHSEAHEDMSTSFAPSSATVADIGGEDWRWTVGRHSDVRQSQNKFTNPGTNNRRHIQRLLSSEYYPVEKGKGPCVIFSRLRFFSRRTVAWHDRSSV